MDPIIRPAVRKDIPRLVELGEEFAYLSAPVHGFKVDRESIIEFANLVIDNEHTVFLVLEYEERIKGFIVGSIVPIYFSKEVALQEIAWYAEKGSRGMLLLDAFEKLAIAKGIDHLIVGNKPQYLDLSKVYLRRKFTSLESHFKKDLRCRS